ncbi:MAG: DNA-3-methyladenine glycosylase [Candidatus Diapherotrites archaeon]|nr:DNA-3-methyladenine glycosylase [Candidatus Diapherotrites archaeon]
MPLQRDFYARNTLVVAKQLLGKVLVRKSKVGIMKGIIIEVEAYKENDPASHSYRGPTKRNAVMYGPPGHAYVYFCYGNHWLLNFVTEKEGTAGAVLIRAIKPTKGIDLMKKNRGKEDLKNLTNGPGKLTKALAIDGKDNGIDITHGNLYVEEGIKPKEIHKSTRIGIKAGTDRKWRFFVKENELQ